MENINIKKQSKKPSRQEIIERRYNWNKFKAEQEHGPSKVSKQNKQGK